MESWDKDLYLASPQCSDSHLADPVWSSTGTGVWGAADHWECLWMQVPTVGPQGENVLRCHSSNRDQQKVQKLLSHWMSQGGH